MHQPTSYSGRIPQPYTYGAGRSNAMNTKSDVFNRLKRISIPTFTGDKRTYEQWKAPFVTCIDSAPISAELKLLQLREYVAGEALQCIQQLGYSANAYEKAKEKSWTANLAASVGG